MNSLTSAKGATSINDLTGPEVAGTQSKGKDSEKAVDEEGADSLPEALSTDFV